MTDFVSPRNHPNPSPAAGPSTADDDQAPRLLINYRLLIGTAVVLMVLVPVANFWHEYQLRRNAGVLFKQGQLAQEREEWNVAADYFFRFLQLRPDDLAGRIAIAESFDKRARTPREKARASDFHARALGLVPDRLELRRRYAELALELGRFPMAETEAGKVLVKAPEDPGALRVLALAKHAQALNRRGDMTPIIEPFEKALAQKPGDIDLALRLADILRRTAKARVQPELVAKADAVIDRMVEADPTNFAAYVARARYRMQFQLPDADADVEKALQLAPDEPPVLLVAGERAVRGGRLDDAQNYYTRLMAEAPKSRDGYLNLGMIYMTLGRHDEALATWQQGLENVGQSDLLLNLKMVEGLLALRRWKEAETNLTRLQGSVRGLISQMSQTERTRFQSRVDFLQAYLEAAKGNYLGAVPLLERVLVSLPVPDRTSPDASQRLLTLMKLAECYAALEEWDRAAAIYQEATTLEPNSTQLMLAAAKVWQRAGRFDVASEKYEQAGRLTELPAEDWAYWAYSTVRHQLLSPPESRNLEECRQVLAKARQHAPDSIRLKLLEAEFANFDGRKEEALRLAKELREAHPDSNEVWHFLVMAYQQWGEPVKALEALATFRSLSGVSGSEATRLRADLLSQREEYAEAIKSVREAIETQPATESLPLKTRLAELLLQNGNRREAVQLLDELVAEFPREIKLVVQCAEVASESRDYDRLADFDKRLEQLEGPSGTWWRFYRAWRLFDQSKSTDEPTFREAVKLETELETRRPNWSRTFVLRGELAHRQGRAADAIAALESALDLGEQSPLVVERLAMLLYAQNRFNEAARRLAVFGNRTAQTPELSALMITLSVQKGQQRQAVNTARDAVARWPDDAMQKVWLGQVLSLTGEQAEAEDAFRAAVKQAPNDFRTWGGLLTFLVRRDQADAARKALTELENLPRDARRSVVLAQGWELLGDAQKAYPFYMAAAERGGNDTQIQLQAGRFFARTNAEQAEKCLRQALKLSPREAEARQALARLLAQRGGEQPWKEGLALLAGPTAGPTDRRLRAALLVERGGAENRTQAIRLLEELTHDAKTAVDADSILLAQLYEDHGEFDRAKDRLLPLANRDGADPGNLAALVGLLLRHDLADEAAPWLEQLERTEPDSTRSMALRAQWLKKQGRAAEIESLLEPFIVKVLARWKDDAQKARFLSQAGELYASLDLPAPAERAYRESLRLEPMLYQPLAVWLAYKGRTSEALDLCIAALKTDETLASSIFLANVLNLGKPTDEDFDRAEPYIARALREHAKEPGLLYAVGTLRYIQGHNDDAIDLYRQTIKLDPTHARALNNLGVLLSDKPEHAQEALASVNKAIDLLGPKAELLDSLGMVLLNLKRTNEALRVLRDAAADPAANPQQFFHLALAYQRSNSKKEAQNALAKAQAKDLASQRMSPTDRELLAELEQELNR